MKKPLLSREGANVSIVTPAGATTRQVTTAKRASSTRRSRPFRASTATHPVLGSWVIDGEPAGMGIRESADLVTTNTSRFVPHLFLPA